MNSTVNNTWCRGTTGLTEGDDGGGRVSHCLGGLMAQEAGCSLPAGARTPKAILKSEPLYARTHTRTRSCSKPWQKMTDTVVAEGQVKFRDGKKVNSTYLRLIFHFKCAPMPRPNTGISFVIYFFPNFFTVEDSVGRSSEALSGRRFVSFLASLNSHPDFNISTVTLRSVDWFV